MGRRANASEPVRRHRWCSLSCRSPSAGPANLRDASAEPGSTRYSTRASERCAMFDSWQIMSIWNMRCAQSQQWASHVSTTTRVCGLGAPDIASCSCHKFEKLQRETRIVRAFVVRPKCSSASQNRVFGRAASFQQAGTVRHIVHGLLLLSGSALCCYYFVRLRV